MKKILILVALAIVSLFTYSQSTVLLRGDTIKVYKQGDTATLKVEGEVMITHYKLGSTTDSVLRWNPVTKKVTMSDIGGFASSNIYNANGILTGNRTLTGLNNTYSLHLDSLSGFRAGRNGVTRFYFDATISEMASQNTNSSVSAGPTQAIVSHQANALRVAVDSSTITKILSYETNINGSLTPNAHATKSYVDSVAAASAPNLQAVTASGNQTTLGILSELSVAASNLGTGAGASIDQGGFVSITNSSGKTGRISATDLIAHHYYELHNTGNANDTLATLSDVRAGGGSSAIVDSAQNGILKFIDYNRNFQYKVQYNPTGTITHNQDSSGQEQFYFTSTGGRTLAFSNLRRGDISLLQFDNTSGSNITLTLPSNSFVNYASAATATIPTGESALSLYLYDGTNYRFIQSSASAGTAAGDAKEVQYNNSGATDGANGFEYQSGASPNVLITAQNAAYTALTVKGATSQSVAIFDAQLTGGANTGFRVDPGGGTQTFGTLSAPTGSGSVEILYTGGVGYIQAYNRAGGYQNMTVGGAAINLATGGTNRAVVSNAAVTLSNRLATAQGADVASLNGAIALGNDGNVFEITGTNSITLITSTNWQNGSEVTFLFTSTAVLTDGTANSGADIGMELNANTNFTGSAGASITLTLSEIGGTQRWREKCRSVN